MVDFPLFDQNYGLTPLQNPSFSTFIPCCFYSLERRFFFKEHRETHFPDLFCLQ